jgi:hypothetical protein
MISVLTFVLSLLQWLTVAKCTVTLNEHFDTLDPAKWMVDLNGNSSNVHPVSRVQFLPTDDTSDHLNVIYHNVSYCDNEFYKCYRAELKTAHSFRKTVLPSNTGSSWFSVTFLLSENTILYPPTRYNRKFNPLTSLLRFSIMIWWNSFSNHPFNELISGGNKDVVYVAQLHGGDNIDRPPIVGVRVQGDWDWVWYFIQRQCTIILDTPVITTISWWYHFKLTITFM